VPWLLFACGLASLSLGSLLLRLPAFSPPSLWLDDEWVALLARHATLPFLFLGKLPASPGFILALRSATSLLGEGEWQLQVVPFLAGLLAILLLGLLALRLTGSHALGFAAAAILAANPLLATYSVRVKQFTLDALVTLVLLSLAAACLRTPALSRFLCLAAGAVLLLPVSFISLFLGLLLVNAIGLSMTLEPAGKRVASRSRLLVVWVGFNLAALALGCFLMLGRGNPSLYHHWRNFYLPTESAAGAASFMVHHGLGLFTNAFPKHFGWLAVLIPLGLFRLLRRPAWRPLGIALLGLYLSILVASGLRLYPIGGGRTDLYIAPVSILLVAVAAGMEGRLGRFLKPAMAVASLGICLVSLRDLRPGYPETGSWQAMERVNELVRDGDALVIYPWSNYAVGYYGRWPARLVEVEDSTNGFYVELDRPGTLVLRETLRGASFESDRSVVAEQLQPLLARGFPRLVYVAIRGPIAPHTWTVETILSQGYEVAHQESHSGALVMVFDRQSG
jgi:hypothetical protein